jgi:hypothetical protein
MDKWRATFLDLPGASGAEALSARWQIVMGKCPGAPIHAFSGFLRAQQRTGHCVTSSVNHHQTDTESWAAARTYLQDTGFRA